MARSLRSVFGSSGHLDGGRYSETVASLEELEARLEALESQVQSIRQDAAAARVLAGGADRDVSAFGAKLDANKSLLEALRETQVEQDKKLDAHDKRFDGLEGEMRAGFSTLVTGQAQITALLKTLIDPAETDEPIDS